MRKIEDEMVAAIRAGRDWRSTNTAVCVSGPIVEVHLHGHLIARRDTADTQDDSWRFNLCGWNTATTRSRINALAQTFGGSQVRTCKGAPYTRDSDLKRVQVPTNGWF